MALEILAYISVGLLTTGWLVSVATELIQKLLLRGSKKETQEEALEVEES